MRLRSTREVAISRLRRIRGNSSLPPFVPPQYREGRRDRDGRRQHERRETRSAPARRNRMQRDDELECPGDGLSFGVRHGDRDAVGSGRRIRVRRVRRVALAAIAEVPVVCVRRRASRDARGEIDADSCRTVDESRRGRHREVDGGGGGTEVTMTVAVWFPVNPPVSFASMVTLYVPGTANWCCALASWDHGVSQTPSLSQSHRTWSRFGGS